MIDLKRNQASYLSEVRRLRAIATDVLKQYPIKPKKISFIKHGESTVFCVIDKKLKKYVLRIHAGDFNNKNALLEEIKWLKYIDKTMDILVPRPLANTDDQYFIQHASRLCHLVEWVPGRFQWKSINGHYAYRLGETIGQLQKNGQHIHIKHRLYWDADALTGVGKKPFKSTTTLTGLSTTDLKTIKSARHFVHRKLKAFQKVHPDKSGLIHADMQPNNFMVHHNRCGVIDFNDCGIGLYGYDLAAPLFAFEYLTQANKNKSYDALKDALFEGYSAHMPFTQQDREMSRYFLLALKLYTIGWIELRKDIPWIKPYFNKAVKRAIEFYNNV